MEVDFNIRDSNTSSRYIFDCDISIIPQIGSTVSLRDLIQDGKSTDFGKFKVVDVHHIIKNQDFENIPEKLVNLLTYL